jgi:large subunit ribosomal protein L9
MAGQVIKVTSGYARNYLFPRSFALLANPLNLKILEKKRNDFEKRIREAKDNALALKNTLEKLVLVIERKSADKGKLYGAVTALDIVESALQQGVELDRRRLKITEPIKSLGEYDIAVKLHNEIAGTFKVKVVPIPVPEPPAVATPEAKGKTRKRGGRGERAREFQDNYPPQERDNYPPQGRDNYPPQGRDNYPPQGRDNYPPQGRDNYPPQGRDNYPPQGRDNYPPQGRDNYPPQGRDNYPPQWRDNYPPQERDNYPPQGRDNYPPQGRENYPPQGRDNYPPQDRENFGAGEDRPSPPKKPAKPRKR